MHDSLNTEGNQFFYTGICSAVQVLSGTLEAEPTACAESAESLC